MSDPKIEMFEIRHERGPFFQTVNVEGVVVTSTPSGKGCLSFYNDRSPLPEFVRYPVGQELTDDTFEMELKGDVVREFCFCAVLDRDSLEMLRDTINDHLTSLDEEDDNNDADSPAP